MAEMSSSVFAIFCIKYYYKHMRSGQNQVPPRSGPAVTGLVLHTVDGRWRHGERLTGGGGESAVQAVQSSPYLLRRYVCPISAIRAYVTLFRHRVYVAVHTAHTHRIYGKRETECLASGTKYVP